MANLKCSRNTSFAFFIIFFVMFIISFGTPFWAWYYGSYSYFNFGHDPYVHGLWQQCHERAFDFDNDCYSFQAPATRLQGVRATMCMALICYFASMVMYSIWISKGLVYLRANGAGSTGIAALSLSLIGGVLTIISVAVFGSAMPSKYLHVSFGMAVTSGCVHVINSSITLVVTACCHNRRTPQHTPGMATMPTNTTTVVFSDTRQTGYQPQPGYPQRGYQPQPNNPQQGYQPQVGYPKPGYQPQPAYQPQPGYQPESGYPQSGYQPEKGYPQSQGIPSSHEAPIGQSAGESYSQNPNPPPYNPHLPAYNPNLPEPALKFSEV